jgi:hypothetical protein
MKIHRSLEENRRVIESFPNTGTCIVEANWSEGVPTVEGSAVAAVSPRPRDSSAAGTPPLQEFAIRAFRLPK